MTLAQARAIQRGAHRHLSRMLTAEAHAVAQLPRWERLWVEWHRRGNRLPPGGLGWVGSSLDRNRGIGAGVGVCTPFPIDTPRPRR